MAADDRFKDIDFNDFRALAKDKDLSKYEKIGFPDSYREGYEGVIFDDICNKLSNLQKEGSRVLDIGPGCSDLPVMLIDQCREKKQSLVLVDNSEMLDLLPSDSFINKVNALYPCCPDIFSDYAGKLDAILCYSVLHYILIDTAFFRFLDLSLSLLAPGGQMLIGDIPNISKRKRFFSSDTGIKYHQRYMDTNELPEMSYCEISHDQIDDSVVFALVQRARLAGFDAYIVPQNSTLPMSNRREDILIVRS